MNPTTRPATPQELSRKFENIPWLARKRRRLAALEAVTGVVEEIEFTVVRAWKLFTCAGPPCCSSEWLLQTHDGGFIQLDSWTELRQTESGSFPGNSVRVICWPESRRLISLQATGRAVRAEQVDGDRLIDFGLQSGKVLLLDRSDLPGHIQQIVAAV